jgi:hypothetical protein
MTEKELVVVPVAESVGAGDLPVNLASFARHLRAENASPKTVRGYSDAVVQFERFLTSQGMPTSVAAIRREHVEAFVEDLLNRRHRNGVPWKPATANNRYRALRAFFRWLLAEGEIRVDPTARMRPPQDPEQPVAVLTDAQLAAILRTCEKARGGTSNQEFVNRRDAALIRVLLDTGIRLGEIAGEAMANVLATFSQFERRLISQRTKEALAAKKRSGVRLGRPRLLPDEVVDQIVDARRRGMTFAAISNDLTCAGIPTSQGGQRWYASTVRSTIVAAARHGVPREASWANWAYADGNST